MNLALPRPLRGLGTNGTEFGAKTGLVGGEVYVHR